MAMSTLRLPLRTQLLCWALALLVVGLVVFAVWGTHAPSAVQVDPLVPTGEETIPARATVSKPASFHSLPMAPRVPVPQQDSLQENADRFAAFEGRFRADSLDAKWAAIAEQNLIDAASEPALVQYGIPTAHQAKCLGHLCKITMDFETANEALDWSELYVVGLANTFTSVRSMVSTNPNGSARLVVYGAREGSEALLHSRPPDVAPHRMPAIR